MRLHSSEDGMYVVTQKRENKKVMRGASIVARSAYRVQVEERGM